MNWIINFLIRCLGAFLTSYGILGTLQTPISKGLVVGFLTVGLALLFAPEIKKK